MDVNVIGQNQMDVFNSDAKLNTSKTDLQKTSLAMSKESDKEVVLKSNRDTFLKNSDSKISMKDNTYSISKIYTRSYSNLNSEYEDFNQYELSDRYAELSKHASTNYREMNKIYSEIRSRENLGYTKDLDAVVNGKLKSMQAKTQYDYYQFDYDFNGDGYNNGGIACAATACAAMLSLSGNITEPTDISTDSNGVITSWPATVTEPDRWDNNKTIDTYMNNIKNELKQGKPCEIHVGNHWVTVVGIKEGVDLEDAKLNELYIFDPGSSHKGKELCTRSANTDYRVVRVK